MTLVQTALGQVHGSQSDGVHRFLGIPYAEPISRDRRFLPAVPKSPWRGVFEATKYGATCIQTPMQGLFGLLSPSADTFGEDCLNVNVWTPDTRGSHPVLVWIHGGAYFAGSGSDLGYDGSSFAKNGVVCVTINYRLGAQGFLDLSAFDSRYESSGCLGIADQVLALEWVRDHIADFGGDPTQVTIAGESAGAMAVSTLLGVPSAKGLFRSAIAQSGGASTVISKQTSGLVTQAIFEALEIDTPAALAGVSDDDLLAAQVEVMTAVRESLDTTRFGELAGSAMAFQPVFGTSVLPQKPLAAISEGAAADIALLQGMTRHEAPIFFYEMAEMLTPEFAAMMSAPLVERLGLEPEAFQQYYHDESLRSGFDAAGRVMSDMLFTVPIAQMLAAQARHSEHLWCYRFDWENPSFNGLLGAHHFIEIPFVFNQLSSPGAREFGLHVGPANLAIRTHLAWVAFVKNGNPNHEELISWPSMTQEQAYCMLFNNTCELGYLYEPEVLALWSPK